MLKKFYQLVKIFRRTSEPINLCRGGIDDSDGTVGGFIEETVIMLKDFVKFNPSCLKAFQKLKSKETCFGWEKPLLKLLEN